MSILKSNQKLKDIFLLSQRIRLTELFIKENYSKQKMRCPIHLSIGQELVASSIGLIAGPKDKFISSHRAHAHYLAKNGSLKKFIYELHGKKEGCSGGKGGSMHLIDLKVNFIGSTAIVGNTIPVGVGAAQAKKIYKEKGVIFIFLGDGAVEEGVFFESLNYAIVHKLPCVFVCENNYYSVYTHIKKRQSNSSIYDLLKGWSIKKFKSNDRKLNHFFRTISNLQLAIKKKQFPIFIELFTHRFLEHCGPNNDDHLNYRKNVKLIDSFEKDPIILLQSLLLRKNIINKKQIDYFNKQTIKEIKQTFNLAEKAPFPGQEDLNKNIYA